MGPNRDTARFDAARRSVDVRRPRFVRNVLCGTAVLALVTVLWSASTYHWELRAPQLLMAAYFVALVAISARASLRSPHRAVERKPAREASPRTTRVGVAGRSDSRLVPLDVPR